MSFIDYIKEKWYMFLIFAIASLFSLAVGFLDEQEFFKNTNAAYIFSGILLSYVIFIFTDYMILRSRCKNLSSFIKNGGTDDFESFYPSDRLYSDEVKQITSNFNSFRAKIADDSAEELEFITTWVHDVKVPISAIKLLLESDSDSLKERLDMELAAIEQNTQKVLFHIKSKSFYDDFKIAKTNTKNLISSSLKQFATFFAFKRINLKLTRAEYSVLTDIKWSGYIISQFLSNAIKHTPEGGDIVINTSETGNRIIVSVLNTGQGIDEKDIGQIFNRGYTSSGREMPKATGYGLYLAKKLANQLGHAINVESEYGKYAKFTLEFLKSE